MSGQPYAVRVSAPAAKVLDVLPEHAADTVWDILAAAAADPWGFGQFETDDDEGEDVRYAAVGQLRVAAFACQVLLCEYGGRKLAPTPITPYG
ncbi:hypothetical protein [Streptomyces sp. KN37]|uniref:hypothetical protein n=1 Tax=Streptomyces sp. KN37 TaxID=3090667 RepID=UPI002A757B8C|nr:hypothetical protein [Streptomyces sp. KN37]WPO76699.1 hypothetical protein R9806_39420 [Streptomyces sp. KN37]